MSVKHHLILIGCVKTKNKDLFGQDSKPNQTARCTPAELYASQLFKFRRLYAEERGLPWAVLSAKYGIWWPATLNRPYDQSFADMGEADRLAWHRQSEVPHDSDPCSIRFDVRWRSDRRCWTDCNRSRFVRVLASATR